MDIDPDNPVVKLCARGIQAEAERRYDEAKALFEQAWAECTDDFEACIAAHYLARQQRDDEAVLAWNEEAVRRADAAGDARVRAFYPSLLLNLGHSHETLGHFEEARTCYVSAASALDNANLPENLYRDVLEEAIARALGRAEQRAL